MTYLPRQEVLQNYANLLVSAGLGPQGGIKKGDVVRVKLPLCAIAMQEPIETAVLRTGGIVLPELYNDQAPVYRIREGSKEQVGHVFDEINAAVANTIRHSIVLKGLTDPKQLNGLDSKLVLASDYSARDLANKLRETGKKGLHNWTLGYFPTENLAKDAGMSLEEYWGELEHALYIDEKDPVAEWKHIGEEILRVREALNKLEIEEIRVTAQDTDLTIKVGEQRQWLGGSGHNLPSYEVFITPDARGTRGHASFSEPLLFQGNKIEGIRLEFNDKGEIIEATARTNQSVLEALVNEPGANRIGEFSLTDSRLSRIKRYMGATLFDENRGGIYGNFHAAVGFGYSESFTGDLATLDENKRSKLGFNTSNQHTDIISTTDRLAEAKCGDGRIRTIYEDGKFTV